MSGPDHDVAIVGSGFAGLGMAIQASRTHRGDYVVLERANALGGTWRASHATTSSTFNAASTMVPADSIMSITGGKG